MSKSKANRQIIAIEDVDFSRLKFEETKESEYINKNMHMSFANYEHTDGTLSTLYFKTPQIDYNLGGLPPSKDKDGTEIDYKDGGRAKWRCYIGSTSGEKKMLEKFQELQAKMVKDKAIIVGSKDTKKFEMEDLIGESQSKDGETLNYARFIFRTEGPSRQIATKFFVRKDNIDDELEIKSVSDIEEKLRRGELRYRMIVSLSKIWKLKATSKFGASFTIEQMQIEMRDDVVSKSVKSIFAKSQFDDGSEENVSQKLSSQLNIADEEEDEKEDEKQDEQEEEDEDEIKPSKTASVTVKKQVRRKGATASS